jgi:hypothetical protein
MLIGFLAGGLGDATPSHATLVSRWSRRVHYAPRPQYAGRHRDAGKSSSPLGARIVTPPAAADRV